MCTPAINSTTPLLQKVLLDPFPLYTTMIEQCIRNCKISALFNTTLGSVKTYNLAYFRNGWDASFKWLGTGRLQTSVTLADDIRYSLFMLLASPFHNLTSHTCHQPTNNIFYQVDIGNLAGKVLTSLRW